MDEKDFKKHLRDLVHGHHHPSEHDWGEAGSPRPSRSGTKKRAPTVRKRRRKS